MAVENPGEFIVTCDECGKDTTMESTDYAGDTFGVDDSTIKEHGWEHTMNGILCEKCLEDYEDDDG